MTDSTDQTKRPAPLCKECGKAMHRGRTKNPLCRDCERPLCPRCGLERVTTVRSKTCMSCVTAQDLCTPRRGQRVSAQAAEDKQTTAKAKIKNSCGHQSDLPTHISPEKAQSYAQWAVKHRLCPHCYARAERQHATNHAVVHQLPPLRGSSKQISWATAIRHAKLREFGNYVDQIGRSADADREVIGRLRAAQKELARSTLAATWIEARDQTLASFVSSCLASASGV
jgi:superfamily II DNA helicase RecQ